jgi:hypothetical protein
VRCKRGKHESIEHYRVLAICTKYYYKWYVATDGTKFQFKRDCKAVKVLGRMMKRQGAAFEEVKLKAGGSFDPKSIFCMRTMNEIMGVDSVLIDYFSSMYLNLHHLKNHTV